MSFSPEEILKLDYEKTLAAIDKYDNHLQEIKNWSITACGAVLLLGLNEKSVPIMMLTFFMAVGFCFIALICKTLLIGARDRAKELETLIQGHDSKQKPHYTFGLVHSTAELRWRNLYRTAKDPFGWHVTAFYCLIIIVASLAVVLGTLFGYFP